ncbi:kinase-like domain-containing protein [Diaporthe sp. PMI_573]|nr:kinase-like domain-containing protein [Diaporthaceae sp. PMI_573]
MLVRPQHYSLSIEEVAGQFNTKRAGAKMLPPSSKRVQALSGAMIASTMAQTRGDSTTSGEPSTRSEPSTTITNSLQPHELAQTVAGQRIVIKNTDTQETEYTLERLGNWVYTRTHTHMFTAVLRNGESSPTVAVLMPKLWEHRWRDLPKRELYAAVHTANSWWRRYDMMVNLKHVSLVSCFGADLRCLSLYLQWPGTINLAAACKDDHYTGGPHDARVILADCSQALKYLASHGIVHNSVTPWSITYRPGDRAGAVLTDFDCAMRRSGAADTGLAPVCYAAPETLQHSGSAESDVWSLGVVMLYAMRLTPLPGTPKHTRSLGRSRLDRLKAWHERVVAIRSTLDTPNDGVAEIVGLMLLPEQTTLTAINGRISPSDLGHKTKRWASTEIFSSLIPHSKEV